MGTETYPKQGRSMQSKSYQGKNKVLQTHAEMIHKVEAPSSQDVCTRSKGKAWDLSRNTMKAC